MNVLTELLDRAEAHAEATNRSIQTISGKLFGNGKRIGQYRSGEMSPNWNTIQAALDKMTELEQSTQKPEAPKEVA